jgi:hypothetical protein
MTPAVHADADHDDQPSFDALPFDQDAGELGVAAEEVIRPFQHQFSAQRGSAVEDRIIRGQCGDERQFGRMVRRCRLVEEKRGVEIARQRRPFVAAPAAPRGLLPRRDPERAALAAACRRQCFGVGRSERLVRRQANARRNRRGMKPHQNSEWAAALATPTSGAG